MGGLSWLYLCLCVGGIKFLLLTLNSAWVSLFPLHSRAFGNIVPPKPPFLLMEDGGNFLLFLSKIEILSNFSVG